MAGEPASKKRKATSTPTTLADGPESPDARDSSRSVSETPTTKSEEGLTPDEKRKRFLERNRVAASKCRQKKKQWMEELEQVAADTRARNKQLVGLVEQMRQEVMDLKNQVMMHRGCEAVEGYLRSNQV